MNLQERVARRIAEMTRSQMTDEQWEVFLSRGWAARELAVAAEIIRDVTFTYWVAV